MSKRKTLAERVKWIDGFAKRPGSIAHVGGIGVVVKPGPVRGTWDVSAFGPFIYVVKARSLKAAKVAALKRVQAAILEAAEAWAD